MSATALSAWDVETDPDNPTPRVWPECPTCHAPFVWRRALSFSKGYIWVWSRDCKHKGDPVLMTADGPYEPDGPNELEGGD